MVNSITIYQQLIWVHTRNTDIPICPLLFGAILRAAKYDAEIYLGIAIQGINASLESSLALLPPSQEI